MKWKGFTPEEIVLLRNNPYTLKVTERTIRFTLPFKQYMLEGLQHGKSPATIVVSFRTNLFPYQCSPQIPILRHPDKREFLAFYSVAAKAHGIKRNCQKL